MSQVKEILLFAAGLVITVTLIFVGFNVFTRALSVGQFIQTREDEKLQALKAEEIEKYEGKTVAGNKIVSYVRSIYDKVDAPIKITTLGDGNAPFSFEISKSNISELRNEEKPYFINPMKKYKVTLSRDKNDSITCIEIKEE